MIVSINQPAYLPWLGYFHRIAIADLHIVLDHVQFEKNSFSNRNKVRTISGWTWLTVPLKTKGRFGKLELNRIEIADHHDWQKKHWQTLYQSYAKAPFFASYGKDLENFYQRPWTRLIDLVREMTSYHLQALGIETPLVFSSELGVAGGKSELILDLCKSIGAEVYLSGPLGRNYLDETQFHKSGVRIAWHDYQHPAYVQRHGSFEPYMAAVDLLLNCGPDSLRVLHEGNANLKAARDV